MRILMASQFYPPVVGGEERHVENLARGMARMGHDVHVVTTAIPGVSPSLDDGGVIVHRVRTSAQRFKWLYSDPQRPHALPVVDPAMRRAIAQLVAEYGFDIVHAHDWIVNSALEVCHDRGVPLALTMHEYSHVCATKRLMRDGHNCEGPELMRCIRCSAQQYGITGPAIFAANVHGRRMREARVDLFVPVSSAVARSTYLPAAKFAVIPNFIPDSLGSELPPSSSNGAVVYAGDLSQDKGVDILLQAYARVPDAPPLVLVGRKAGASFEQLPNGASYLGVLPHDEVMALMASAALVVVPSIVADCCPTVVLEAMAFGCPIVASSTGGIVDMITDGESGRLVPPGDAAALAKAMTTLLQDPSTARALGEAARAAVGAFRETAVLSRLEMAYRTLTDRSRALTGS